MKRGSKSFCSEIASPSLWRDVISEVVATSILMGIQAAVPLSWNSTQGGVVQCGLAMGCVVLVMIEGMGALGGAHMNPAVTLAQLVARKVSFVRAVLYCTAQCVGALLGTALIYVVTPEDRREGLSATVPHPSVTWWQALVVETWLTFVLMLVILGSTNPKRKSAVSPALPIGFTVAMNIFAAAKYSGAGMNPARSLGPAVVMGIWDHHWIYWVGPIAGAQIATIAYVYGLDKVDNPSKQYKEMPQTELENDVNDSFESGHYDELPKSR